MNLGEIIKRERLKLKLTQTELAKLIGHSQSNISDIERGEMPKFDITCLLCEVFEIFPNEMWNKIKNEYEPLPKLQREEGGIKEAER